MLLLDEDQLSDKDLPSSGGDSIIGHKKKGQKENLLSEIAEEDD
jgi:hypothetical protein